MTRSASKVSFAGAGPARHVDDHPRRHLFHAADYQMKQDDAARRREMEQLDKVVRAASLGSAAVVTAAKKRLQSTDAVDGALVLDYKLDEAAANREVMLAGKTAKAAALGSERVAAAAAERAHLHGATGADEEYARRRGFLSLSARETEGPADTFSRKAGVPKESVAARHIRRYLEKKHKMARTRAEDHRALRQGKAAMSNAKVLAAQDRKARAEESFCAETKAALEVRAARVRRFVSRLSSRSPSRAQARLEAAGKRKEAGVSFVPPAPAAKKTETTTTPPSDEAPESLLPAAGLVVAGLAAVASLYLRLKA